MIQVRQVVWVAVAAAGVLAATAEAAEPVISVEPQRGIPGQTVLVTGHDFCSSLGCGLVRIQLYGAVVSTGVRVSSSGSFAQRIRVPGGAPTGDVGLIATQLQPNGSDVQAFADFEMAVRLRTERAKPSQEEAPPVSRPGERAVPGSSRVTGHARTPPRDDRRPVPSSTMSGARAATVHSGGTVDDARDLGLFLAVAAIVLSVGAALALAVALPHRGGRSTMR